MSQMKSMAGRGPERSPMHSTRTGAVCFGQERADRGRMLVFPKGPEVVCAR
jgi:hypothetical protein